MNITTIIAMLLIAMLEVVAIVNEINGALLAGSIAIIAGLGGYTAGKKRQPK
ncbi:unnamed protein product [marine sediment metagenome]|uniref:Uncharacterized protein n=1 Tax=marine sediment metagenome TaxID=412755 RepID=X1KNU6_9ZZZZ